MTRSHPQVPHPGRISRGRGGSPAARWNDRAVDWLTDHVLASTVMFDLAFILPLLVLPLSTSVKVTLGVVSGSWIQWWALPALQRSANRADRARDAKADTDHIALTHIANRVDEIRAAIAAGKDQIVTASAQGADVSGYQPSITAQQVRDAGLSFAFCKATNGLSGTDPDFASDWAAIGNAGVFRGAYHELTGGDPVLQAHHFVSTVAGQGLRPGDMLAVSLSDYDGITGAHAKAFLDQAAALAGPKCPVLAYSDLSFLPSLAGCTGYPLWLALFGETAPPSVAPWGRWTFWQWQAGGGADGGDADAFNGTAAELGAWIASYANPAPPADWAFGPVRGLAVEAAGPHSVKLSWSSPGTPMPLAVGGYEIAVRHNGQDVGSYPRAEAKEANPQTWQGGSLTPGTAYTALVRAVATDGGHASPWATVSFKTSG